MTRQSEHASQSIARAAMPGTGHILTVASGKGGVGKTWFSTTFAQSLAFRGQRIVLFDGDLGLANVDVQLGITPKADLGAVVAGQMALKDAVTPYQGGAGKLGGFDVLAGRSGSGALAALQTDELVDLASTLKEVAASYDHLIIDLAAGIDKSVMTLSCLANTTLVVATDEPTSLTDAYAFIKLLVSRRREADIRVVVNMADSVSSGRRTFETLANACRNFLQFTPVLAGVIHRDSKVKEAIRRQSPLLRTYAQARAAQDIELVSKSVIPD